MPRSSANSPDQKDENELDADEIIATILYPELQESRCVSARYDSYPFPRCTACIRRQGGDGCRFQGIRTFLKDERADLMGFSFPSMKKVEGENMLFPNKWNVALEAAHVKQTKLALAASLQHVLKSELEHLGLPDVIIRPRESQVRATCDVCLTSLFSSSWMCRMCGRELCTDCFDLVKELAAKRPANGVGRIKAKNTNAQVLVCSMRNQHLAKDFSPVSRFFKEKLEETIAEMSNLLNEVEGHRKSDGVAGGISTFHLQNIVTTVFPELEINDVNPNITTHHTIPSSSTLLLPAATTDKNPYYVTPIDEIPSYPTLHVPVSALTDDMFQAIWAKGRPFVVTGLLPRFNIEWTPEFFIKKYGSESCFIVECQTNEVKQVTVGEFFRNFGDYTERKKQWKLKDWPPSADFRSTFPDLYADFSRAVPVPNFVRRDGVLNISSHFPSNVVAPDLGPKMYNAQCSHESPGSHGTTKLHMDMADALNIMVHSETKPNGQPGCAAWDLFRAEDSQSIRKYLRMKFIDSPAAVSATGKGRTNGNIVAPALLDPIHSQEFYLDSALRKELLEKRGVKSHRVYQTPGQAVFIPAGCAHQVCNLSDCIKVASDFVSPHNISRCATLTKEFRNQNQYKAWKEDVLQLRTMMWFAWQSCSRNMPLASDDGKDVVNNAAKDAIKVGVEDEEDELIDD